VFASELVLAARFEPGEWALTTPLIWQEKGFRVEVPIGFVTDLASIPAILRGALNVTGLSRRAAVLHDYAYCAQTLSREHADQLLRRALIADGMPATTARLYWLGVRTGGASHWNDRAAGMGILESDFVSQEAFSDAVRQPALGFEGSPSES
jgi:hypothetical protein